MKQDYRLYNLYDEQFEKLVCALCREILGTGTVEFSLGADGGRDGYFDGTAEAFPSSKKPHKGKFVIQAKHTSNPTAKCGDNDFKSAIKQEKEKITKLVEAKEADYYLVFTNRKLSGGQEVAFRKELKETGLKKCHIFGAETIAAYLHSKPNIVKLFGLLNEDKPFHILPDDMTEVVIAFHDTLDNINGTVFGGSGNFTYLDKKKKNKLNNLSKEYYQLILESLKYFADIKEFLSNPRNTELSQYYHDTADEIRQKILLNKDKFESFDQILTYLYECVIDNNPPLRSKRRYVTIFLHYMYYNCDIGQKDAAAN